MTTITVNPDRSVRIETETHLCVLPYHPETMAPFASDAEAEAFARSVASDPRYMVPKPAPAAPTFLQKVSPIAFMLLFTSQERLRIRQARRLAHTEVAPGQPGYDDHVNGLVIDDWMTLVEDPRMQIVDLTLPATQDGIDFLVYADIISAERAAEIKQGFPE